MKRTIQKFQISNRLDAANASPIPLEDSELKSFAQSMVRVDQRLRAGRTPAPDAPAWLHASIMNEVRRADARTKDRPLRRRLRPFWAWAVAGVTLVVAVWMLSSRSYSRDETLFSAGQADADGVVRAAASQGATAVVKPFEVELENLSRDLDRTAEFLLASLP